MHTHSVVVADCVVPVSGGAGVGDVEAEEEEEGGGEGEVEKEDEGLRLARYETAGK